MSVGEEELAARAQRDLEESRAEAIETKAETEAGTDEVEGPDGSRALGEARLCCLGKLGRMMRMFQSL